MLLPPLLIAAASPKLSEATKVKQNTHSHQAKEKTEISKVRNGDVNLITKPEPARVPSNIHNHPDYNIEDKPAHNDGTGNTTHISSDRSHSHEPSNFSSNSNGNLVYDPGGNDVDTEDGSMRVDNDSDSSNRSHNTHSLKPSDFGIGINSNSKFVYDPGGSSSNTKDNSICVIDDNRSSISIGDKPRSTDAHLSCDCDRDKTSSSPPDANAVPPVLFVQATSPVLNVRSLCSTNNNHIPQADSKCIDTAQHPLPFQQLADPLNPNHTHHRPQPRACPDLFDDASTHFSGKEPRFASPVDHFDNRQHQRRVDPGGSNFKPPGRCKASTRCSLGASAFPFANTPDDATGQ